MQAGPCSVAGDIIPGVRFIYLLSLSVAETAMLLPASLSWSRDVNATHDIRRNLRLRYPKDPADENE